MGKILLESGGSVLEENGNSFILAEYPTNRIVLESGSQILLEDKSSSIIEQYNSSTIRYVPVNLLAIRAL